MIITRLLGGLGNQMFQYAAGLAVAHRRRTVLKLDVSWFGEDPAYEDHNRYSLSAFNILEQFATEEEVRRIRGVRRTRTETWLARAAHALRLPTLSDLHRPTGSWHIQEQFSPYPKFSDIPDHTYLDGMWQSEEFFAPVADLLRLHFTPKYPELPDFMEWKRRMQSTPSVAIHFRRGDYGRNAAFSREMGVVNTSYYHRAVEEIRARVPGAVLYVFSDDIDAVEKEFRPGGDVFYVRPDPRMLNAGKMRLMSQCQHLIIANSTFSWWAAWLHSAPERIVIAPEPWFADSRHDGSKIVPSRWIRLPRD
jgi:hypothetical protein